MSGLYRLTREQLIEVVLKLEGMAESLQREIVQLREDVQQRDVRIRELEEEVARLRGSPLPLTSRSLPQN